ncbi:MAG: 4Fe-4S binding protein [Chloroflexota bacterium]|nr:4Fe-4S binding protein [Chloroflexota bacterium]
MQASDVNLTVDFLGHTLRNPLALTEGPLTGSADRIRRAAGHSIGIMFTKGIRPQPATSPNPFIAKTGRSSLMNADWSDIGFEQWLEEIEALRERDFVLVTSIAKNYVTPQEAADMAAEIAKRDPDAISLVDYDPDDLIRAVKLARPRVNLPLMVKLCPFMPRLEQVLKELVAAGIDAVAAMDSIGPVLVVDVETGLPSMGSEDGSGYLSGEAIKSVMVKYVYEISRFVDLPVVGVGGVNQAEDVVEVTMVGGTVVGMVAAPLLRGLRVFDRVEGQLREHLAGRGLADINALRGLTHRRVAQEGMRYDARAAIDPDKCTNCGLCARVCFKQAPLEEDGSTRIRAVRCVGCGLCASVCPQSAIALI